MEFVSQLFISLDDAQRNFSLRETAIFTSVNGQKTQTSLHVRFLSSVLVEAISEARAVAYENKTELVEPKLNEFPPNLRDIKQAKQKARQEVLENRQREEESIREFYAANKAARLQRQKDLIDSGIFSFGKYENDRIDQHADYAAWLVSKKATFVKGSILEYAANAIETKFPQLLEKVTYSPGHRSEKEKTRIEIKGKVVTARSFATDFGRSYWIFIKDENGFCIVSKGSWWADEGTEVNITAFLKEKTTYQDQDQTIINRVKGGA